jgi:hypothetical protein
MTAAAPDDLVAKSTAVLASVGFSFIPLLHPIGAWELLCVSPRGLTLVAARPEAPNLMGTRYQVPAGWPAGTVRLILVWGADPLPTAITL